MSVKQSSDNLLHKLTKHTNISVPFSKYVLRETFPEQDSDKLDKIYKIQYRDRRLINPNDTLKNRPRPLDDLQRSNVIPDRPEKYEEPDITQDKFRIIRFDKTEPYKFIAVSENYKHCLVGNSQYDIESQVLVSTKQFSQYIGLIGFDQYITDLTDTKCVVFSVDNLEPLHSVLIEFLPDGTFRAVLEEECFTKLYDYYNSRFLGTSGLSKQLLFVHNMNISIEQLATNNKYNTEELEENMKKLDPLQYNRLLDDKDIANIRYEIIGERRPYGISNSKG